MHRTPVASERRQKMAQICPQMESLPRKDLLSPTSPVSSSEAGSTPSTPSCCAQDSFPSWGKAVGGGHAGPCLEPTVPLTYSCLSPTGTAARPHARNLQRPEDLHRAPGALQMHRRMAQVRPQTESHPRESLPSSDVPPTGTEAGRSACPATTRLTVPGKT